MMGRLINAILLPSGRRRPARLIDVAPWIDEALADWATPIAALGVRPGHCSETEYYSAPPDNLRTSPRTPISLNDVIDHFFL